MSEPSVVTLPTILTKFTESLNAHSTALIANTIAMGMNADNCIATIKEETPPYGSTQYIEMLKEFGLVKERDDSN
jgi:hypothetical protein